MAEAGGLVGSFRDQALRSIRGGVAALTFEHPKTIQGELAIIAGLCVACAAFAVYQLSLFELARLCYSIDIWFDSDPAARIGGIVDRGSRSHARSSLHPLYPLFVAAPFATLSKLTALGVREIVTLYVGLKAACLGAAIYVALRSYGLARVDALLGLLACASTASFIYWIGLPEWQALGAASVLVSAAWLAAPRALQGRVTGAAQSVLSASIATTSWMFGIAASFFSRWPKPAWTEVFQHTRDALAVLAALTVVQYFIFPFAGGFLNLSVDTEILGKRQPDATFLNYLAAFFSHTLVAPAPDVIEGVRPSTDHFRVMTFQMRPIALAPLAVAALSLWAALCVISVRRAIADAGDRILFLYAVGGLAFFFVLHAMYGIETFLFSLQFVPLMTLIALWGARSRRKTIVRVLCVALIAAGFAHNYPMFRSAVAVHNAVDPSWWEEHLAFDTFNNIACE